MGIKDMVTFNVPQHPQLRECNGIISWAPWYTEGHLEKAEH